eukprot:scaffold97731_cov23-Tisochrysis_lutea.AAC.1
MPLIKPLMSSSTEVMYVPDGQKTGDVAGGEGGKGTAGGDEVRYVMLESGVLVASKTGQAGEEKKVYTGHRPRALRK